MFGQCGNTRRKIEGSKALMGSSIGPKLENVPLRAIGTRKMEMLWTVSGHICGGGCSDVCFRVCAVQLYLSPLIGQVRPVKMSLASLIGLPVGVSNTAP